MAAILYHLISFLMVKSALGKDEEASRPFLVKVYSCSGALIADNWVLTAAHCFQSFINFSSHPQSRDKDIKIKEGKLRVMRVLSPWEIIKVRNATRIIIHGSYLEDGSLSWKGFDLALVQLSQPFNNQPYISKPACLPSADFPEHSDNLYVAGYGRIQAPFCVTDTEGPEEFATCGSPKTCDVQRDEKCGLEFLYRDKTYKECIKDQPTPSASDLKCLQLATQFNFSNTKRVRAHILTQSNSSLVHRTTCYFPLKPPKSGWCTVRDRKNNFDTEPQANRGWGYCGEGQDYCNRKASFIQFTHKARRSHLFSEQHCLDKLGDNLAVEQPQVQPEEYRDHLFDTYKIFCAGRKESISHNTDQYFLMDEKSKHFSQLTSDEGRPHVNISNSVAVMNTCFGDSGGPLFNVVKTDSKENANVVIGIFSFLLWGTCRARDDMGYFVRVRELRQWILKYIPQSKVCTVDSKGRLIKPQC